MFYLSFADIAEVSMNYLKKGGKIRLDESICSSRSFLQLVKSFFKKLFIFLKKSLMFLSNYFSRGNMLSKYLYPKDSYTTFASIEAKENKNKIEIPPQ